jgi:lysophospholipase L1-like esterase
MRRIVKSLVAAVVVLAPLITADTATATASVHGASTYYLSLGDSLAAGFQPPPVSHGYGYANQLYRAELQEMPNLVLDKLGCPGESTDTMLHGGLPWCAYSSGTQVAEAEAFLLAHAGQMAFITIDIGANDVLGTDGVTCWDEVTGRIHLPCIQRELPGIQRNLSTIIRRLAAAAPGVPILGMSYYDPFVGYWVLLDDGHHVARSDETSWAALNAGLLQTYRDEGAIVADVAGADFFDSANFTDTVSTKNWGVVPRNVAIACRNTWFCRPCRACPDVHTDTKGYGIVAEAFEQVLAAWPRAIGPAG